MSCRRDWPRPGRWAGSRSRRHEQPRDSVDLEALLQTPLGHGFHQGGDRAGRRRAEHAVAVLDGLEAEPDGQVRLADARRNSHMLRSFHALSLSTTTGIRSSAKR